MAMDLGMGGQAIADVTADFTVSLRTDAGFEVRIETAFGVQAPGGAVNEYVPGNSDVEPQVEALRAQRVVHGAVDDSGVLDIGFESGLAIRVVPDEAYEAWTVAGPQGMKVVCMPGGELASWSPRSDQDGPVG